MLGDVAVHYIDSYSTIVGSVTRAIIMGKSVCVWVSG